MNCEYNAQQMRTDFQYDLAVQPYSLYYLLLLSAHTTYYIHITMSIMFRNKLSHIEGVCLCAEQFETFEQFGYIFGPILGLCAKWNGDY